MPADDVTTNVVDRMPGAPDDNETEAGFIRLMKDRFNKAQSADSDLRLAAIEDIEFVDIPGRQWQDDLRAKRRKRPTLEFNRLRQSVKQVKNEQRQNRPQIKLRATDSKADPLSTEVMQGIIKNIESISQADRAYDTAFEFAIKGGYGVWRIATEYVNDDAFEQDIIIKEVRNPFAVRFDPSAREWTKQDGMYAFVDEMISRDEYKSRWPGKEPASFSNGIGEQYDDWNGANDVRICEYWVREFVDKTVFKLSDGTVVEDTEDFRESAFDMAQQGITIIDKRTLKSPKVTQYIVDGQQILEGPNDWAGRYIPIVPIWGDSQNIKGREYWCGMVRHAKDPARTYNFHRSAMIERVAAMPLAPYIATPAMVEGYEKYWLSANSENYSLMLYNVDPKDPTGRPKRAEGPEVPAALMQLAAIDADDIKATTGIYDASLGARSNETSGKAIFARDSQAKTANYDYTDNLARSIQFTGVILVDLIPKIYDTQRMVRILGEDGAEKYAVINAQVAKSIQHPQDAHKLIIPNLTYGKYDVTVTTGPSYATQRMEATDQLMQLSQASPDLAPLLADLIVKNLDMPGGDEVVKRIRMMAIKQGLIKPETPEEAPPPDPMQQMQQQLMQMMAQLQAQAAQLANEKTQLENAKAQMDLVLEHSKNPVDLDQAVADLINTKLDAALKERELSMPIDAGDTSMDPKGD